MPAVTAEVDPILHAARISHCRIGFFCSVFAAYSKNGLPTQHNTQDLLHHGQELPPVHSPWGHLYHFHSSTEWTTGGLPSFSCNSVPVSAGTELICTTVSGMMLYFGCRRKTLLITQLCFSCCWAMLLRAKNISASHPALPARGWGAHGAGRGQNQGRWPKLSKGTFPTIWHPMKKQ